MVWCILVSRSFEYPSPSVTRSCSLQTRSKKRRQPLTPSSDQLALRSNAPMNISYVLRVSAP